jgi:hypothetical protein
MKNDITVDDLLDQLKRSFSHERKASFESFAKQLQSEINEYAGNDDEFCFRTGDVRFLAELAVKYALLYKAARWCAQFSDQMNPTLLKRLQAGLDGKEQ